MALDFPTSPTDGQIYGKYYWNNTAGVWQLLSDTTTFGLASNTPTGSYTDGADYEYVSFTASGTLTVTRGGFFDALLVGGGGSGGHGWGGGGGAGGHLYLENAYLPAGSLDVVVGSGGAGVINGGADMGNQGISGLPSSLWKYFAPGGGGGGAFKNPYSSTQVYSNNGTLGGSGGGASAYGHGVAQPGGVGVTSLGNDGGSGYGGSGGGATAGDRPCRRPV